MRLPNSYEILISHFPVLSLAQESGNAQAHYNMGLYCIIGSYLASLLISHAILGTEHSEHDSNGSYMLKIGGILVSFQTVLANF